jgi:hypothetical protein
MRLFGKIAAFAVKQIMGQERGEALVNSVRDRFGDNSTRVQDALQTATERAWNALELSLTGESWWDHVKARWRGGDETALRTQIKAFLQSVQLTLPPADQEPFRLACLAELRTARQQHLLPGDPTPLTDVAQQAAALNRFNEQDQLLRAELAEVDAFAQQLHTHGFPHLATFVALRVAGKRPLLVTAVRFFFRRELENDPKLFSGLAFDQLDSLSQQQQAAFAQLHDTLRTHGQALRQALDDLAELKATTQATLANTEEILSSTTVVAEEVRQLRAQMSALLATLAQQQRTAAEVIDAEVVHSEQRTHALVTRVQALPPAQRAALAPVVQTLTVQTQALTVRHGQLRKQVRPNPMLFGGSPPVPTPAPVSPPASAPPLPRKGKPPNPKLFGPT